MEFTNVPRTLLNVFNEFEQRVSTINDLQEITIHIVEATSAPEDWNSEDGNFDSSPAFFRKSNQTITINSNLWCNLPKSAHLAIIAHEVAHAFLSNHPFEMISELRVPLNEERVCDFLACSWGFANELIEERRNSSGNEYANILSLWNNRQKYTNEMSFWQMREIVR